MSEGPSETAILQRAQALAGRSIGSLGLSLGFAFGKGGVGELVERALGLEKSCDPGPDFAAAGVEVKTLPVDAGKVVESTWVCSAAPESIQRETWESSRVRAKLARVLFVPVEASLRGREAQQQRRVGTAFLWSPAADDEAVLRRDWEDLADLVAHGLGFAVTARRGKALQLRPKARDASVMRTIVDVEGEIHREAPQGFYLRTSFTQKIVDAAFPGAR